MSERLPPGHEPRYYPLELLELLQDEDEEGGPTWLGDMFKQRPGCSPRRGKKENKDEAGDGAFVNAWDTNDDDDDDDDEEENDVDSARAECSQSAYGRGVGYDVCGY